MKTLEVKWTGIRPLIMHNGLMADPTNSLVRRIKEITSKGTKKLTDADYEERDRLEWEAGLYWDEEDGLIVPSDNIERCIQLLLMCHSSTQGRRTKISSTPIHASRSARESPCRKAESSAFAQ
jgi:hypothetical protein